MGTNNISLYKEVDKKYSGCNLKTMELLDCELIGECAVIRLNYGFRHTEIHRKKKKKKLDSFSWNTLFFSTEVSLQIYNNCITYARWIQWYFTTCISFYHDWECLYKLQLELFNCSCLSPDAPWSRKLFQGFEDMRHFIYLEIWEYYEFLFMDMG